jgi:hypothetical protein
MKISVVPCGSGKKLSRSCGDWWYPKGSAFERLSSVRVALGNLFMNLLTGSEKKIF